MDSLQASGLGNGGSRPTIFNFDRSMLPLIGDIVFIEQLSIQMAVPRVDKSARLDRINNTSALISGRNGSLLEVLPEMGYFRDIVFYFKHAVSGKGPHDPSVSSAKWIPSDATLHWTSSAYSKDDPRQIYRVHAFHGWGQEFIEIVETVEDEKKKSTFTSFLNMFRGKSPIERQRLSSADPTTVVNSLSEKLAKK